MREQTSSPPNEITTKPFSLLNEDEWQRLTIGGAALPQPSLSKGPSHMATLARVLAYVTGTDRRVDSDLETLKIIVIFCGAGLLVSLLCVLFFLTYGLDLSPGFF